MSVSAQWDNEEKTVIRYDMQGRWTWDEFYLAYEEAKTMLRSVPHTVHFITQPLDSLSNGYMPTSALTHIINIYRKALPNSGATVTIGNSNFARAMVSILGRVAPNAANKFLFAKSLEEARLLLAKKIAEEKPDSNP